jgi:hypothetical protein
VLVQSPLPGKTAVAKLTPAHRQFLASLRNGRVKPAASTQMVQTLPSRFAALYPPHPELDAALEAVMPILEYTDVASTIVHGDFAAWNLRTHGGRIHAFDWEYAELDGLPLVDETHYMLQLGYQLQNWTPDQAHAELAKMAAAKPVGFEPEQVTAIQIVYFLDNLARLFNEGYSPEDDFIIWYRSVLAKLVATMKKPEATLV